MSIHNAQSHTSRPLDCFALLNFQRNEKSSCSPFVALNSVHHLLVWTAECSSSRVAAASLRCNSLATASCCTLTNPKNTALVLLIGSNTPLARAGRPALFAEIELKGH